MKKNMKKSVVLAAASLLSLGVLAGCASDATIMDQNLTTAADQFEIQRKIIGINGITDTPAFEVEGRCSITADTAAKQLEVICKHGEDDYRKHFVGLSDNVYYVVTQLDGVDASVYRTRIIIKPENIIPDFDLETSGGK